MIEKKNENSTKTEPLEEDEMEVPNFKLLYRNTTNPERDKSSGVSSDEETTSSSLAPIPDTLKQFRKSKWTVSDTVEQSESETAYVCQDLRKSTGNIINSLEEIRKKYILRNEASVTLKMNSANLMLDDILNNAKLNKTLVNDHHPKYLKKDEFKQKTDIESEFSTTDTSVSRREPCTHFADHSHIPIALDYYSPPCPIHCSAFQHVNTPEEKDPLPPKTELEGNHRKKSLMERFQDLQLKYRIQTVYKTLQKTRNPFTKSRKDFENNIIQGIPGTGCQGDAVSVNEAPRCKCNHPFPNKMILDLIESSEISQSDMKSTGREEHHCTCMNQRKCNCPEVIPNCVCVQHIQITSDSSRQNSPHSEAPDRNNTYNQASQPVAPATTTNAKESSLLVGKENEDNGRENINTLTKNFKADWRNCSKEKNVIERTDIYYFDHGNSAYYQTTDNHPMRYTECLIERTDEYATKFWAEFFGTFEIGIAFLISFILQLYRFLFTSIIRSLTVGLLQIFSDYLLKPLLTVLFNGIIQPCLILAYNVGTSIRDLCRPISEIFGFFAKEIANILRSCRLVEVNRERQSSCHCENKV